MERGMSSISRLAPEPISTILRAREMVERVDFRVFTRNNGLFDDRLKIPPLGITEQVLQISGIPKLAAAFFRLGDFLEIGM